MLETRYKLSKEDEDLILSSLEGNYNKLRFIKGFNYQTFLPPHLRSAIRRLLGITNFKQKRLINNFELTNPIDYKSNYKPENIWPLGKTCAFISTHDIDSKFGQEFLKNFIEIEKKLGVKSTNFWVTHLYELKHSFLKELQKEGFEIALHDYNHDGRLVMLSKDEIRKRLELSKDFISKYSVKGIRSPGFLRSKNFYHIVKEYFSYDMSIIDFSYLFPFSGDGCKTAMPFYLDNLLIMPTSLLRDGEARAMRLKPKEILNFWINKYNWLKSKNCLIVLLTHPEQGFSGNNEMLSVYKEFLEYLTNDSTCWITTAINLSDHLKEKKEKLIQLTLGE